MIKYLNSSAEYDKLVSSGFCLVYMSHDHCNICKSLRPKIEQMVNTEFNEVKLIYVDTTKFPDTAALNQIFTAPVILFFIDGKEYFRFSRNISIPELKEKIKRLLTLYN